MAEPAGQHDVTAEIAARVEMFVRDIVVAFEQDSRWSSHGPTSELLNELRNKATAAGVLTPHVRADGSHLDHRSTVRILRAAGLSPLGPAAVNTAAPDEGNMYLLGKVGTPEQKEKYLAPLLSGRARSAFLMTEPAAEGGAGSDPTMLQTTARADGEDWIISGRKAFVTGAQGAFFGIVMAKTTEEATMFLVPFPQPSVVIERVLDTIDRSMPGGHGVVALNNVRVSGDCVLGEVGAGFSYAQVRLAPARLTHCARWLGACIRAQEIATEYAVRRQSFGRALIDHEGVGFMLAENLIALKQAELMIDWCADVLDSGASGGTESAMTKVAVSESLYRVADNCVQVMGGTGVTRDTIVEQVFREIRAFRIYDGPTEVHKWSLAKHIRRNEVKRCLA
jgi:acyl-CoA dehydrogenase